MTWHDYDWLDTQHGLNSGVLYWGPSLCGTRPPLVNNNSDQEDDNTALPHTALNAWQQQRWEVCAYRGYPSYFATSLSDTLGVRKEGRRWRSPNRGVPCIARPCALDCLTTSRWAHLKVESLVVWHLPMTAGGIRNPKHPLSELGSGGLAATLFIDWAPVFREKALARSYWPCAIGYIGSNDWVWPELHGRNVSGTDYVETPAISIVVGFGV